MHTTEPANLTGMLTGFIGALPDIHAGEQDVVASGDLAAVASQLGAITLPWAGWTVACE